MSQDKLAGLLNVGKSTISMWESLYRTPSFDTLNDISKILDCSITDLIEGYEKFYSFVDSNSTSILCCPECGAEEVRLLSIKNAYFNEQGSRGFVLMFFCSNNHFFRVVFESKNGKNGVAVYTKDHKLKPLIFETETQAISRVEESKTENLSQTKDGDSDIDMELYRMINELPLLKKAEAIIKINEIKERQ